jgi:hypothetical protein
LSRFDKYDPVSGGFRAPLAAAILAADVGKIQAVSIAASTGLVTIGGPAETAIIGVICPDKPYAAGDMIDVMTHGEIVEATFTAGTAFAAGALVYGHGTAGGVGTIDVTSTTGKVIGKTIELNRLVVRVTAPTT